MVLVVASTMRVRVIVKQGNGVALVKRRIIAAVIVQLVIIVPLPQPPPNKMHVVVIPNTVLLVQVLLKTYRPVIIQLVVIQIRERVHKHVQRVRMQKVVFVKIVPEADMEINRVLHHHLVPANAVKVIFGKICWAILLYFCFQC